MTNFIQREQVILFSFPAPNPQMLNEKNIMGQTEDELWDAVERCK